jgi:hypothetical protein
MKKTLLKTFARVSLGKPVPLVLRTLVIDRYCDEAICTLKNQPCGGPAISLHYTVSLVQWANRVLLV